jgi:hypothetical protein
LPSVRLRKNPDGAGKLMIDAMDRMGPSDSERSDAPPASQQQPRCVACHDVIGVYEPLVHVLAGLAWRTSRAAEPQIGAAGGDSYHLECHTRLADGRATS